MESWETFKEVITLDELEAWMYQVGMVLGQKSFWIFGINFDNFDVQVIPTAVIPSVNEFNSVICGVRLTQRRVQLTNHPPLPLQGSYNEVQHFNQYDSIIR